MTSDTGILYQSLDIESYQIRLLSFTSSRRSPGFECILERHSLVDAPQFNALSYCWGDEPAQCGILINRVTVLVTRNLEAALRRLRAMDSRQRLWIDALCINQDDKTEKSQQVKQMKDVYERAELTYSWLGPSMVEGPTPLSQLQIQLPVPPVAQRSTTQWNGFSIRSRIGSENLQMSHIVTVSQCQTLLQVLLNEYWKRRWIIQEIIAAKQVRIIDDDTIVTLEDFTRVLRQCSASMHWTSEYEMGSTSLREILRLRQVYIENGGLSLCRTVFRTKDYRSKDARDRVFALIGICVDGRNLVPLPNYHQTEAAVSRDLTRRVIGRNANLDIILFRSTKISNSSSFPSWNTLLLQSARLPSSSYLPSWSPDWLSTELDKGLYPVAETAPQNHLLLATQALRLDQTTLRVQGCTLGTIVGRTCFLGSNSSEESSHACTCENNSGPTTATIYYGNTSGAAKALAVCLSSDISPNHGRLWRRCQPGWMFGWKSEEARQSMQELAYSDYCLSLTPGHVRYFRLLLRGSILSELWSIRHRLTQEKEPLSEEYRKWIRHHEKFAVHEETVSTLLARQTKVRVLMYCLMPLSYTFVLILLAFPWVLIGVFKTLRDRWILVLGSVVVALFIDFVIWQLLLTCIWEPCREFLGQMDKDMRLKMDTSQRLVVLDTGIMGMSCPSASLGDIICFVAGCTSLVVLRPQQNGSSLAYVVVGMCSVELTSKDTNKYKKIRKDITTREDFEKLMTELEGYDGWKEYDLI